MTTTLVRNATLVDLCPARVARADLRIAGERIVERGDLTPQPGEKICNLTGFLVLPGMVCAHTHLYSSLARGMPLPAAAPRNFLEILQRIWWRLDRALDAESIYLASMIGAVEAIRAGTTTLVDHHSSPAAIAGSLSVIERALGEVGLRGVLCYEISDRGGPAQLAEAIAETRAFLAATKGPLIRGMVGAHATFTLATTTLETIAALATEHAVGVHIHLAEDRIDLEDAEQRYGCSPLDRLLATGCLGPRTLLAHGTHLSERALATVNEQQAWLVHNPRSNMNNQVGYAPVAHFGERAALGCDGLVADMLEEARMAYFKARDATTTLGVDGIMHLVTGAARFASETFQQPIGTLEAGGIADLVVMDYLPPTPLAAENVAAHLIFGMSATQVVSVMVAGRWVMWQRQFPAIDLRNLYARARDSAPRIWQHLQTMPELPWPGPETLHSPGLTEIQNNWRRKDCSDV
ncbi:MAG: amidohydrolase family protein [Cyanobacteria bacterium NC_groundwater_1444_Ag_S-0.65um_54_12]|nr:amidohydrolase family protein [Cyanobacteria bacterium NC_groundwater_1444_Ag_S-0.65um_54_12]